MPRLFLLLPLIEVVVFILVGAVTGFEAAFAALGITMVVGLVLLVLPIGVPLGRMTSLGAGGIAQMGVGMVLKLVGLLLFIPGFVTDLMALVVLLAMLAMTVKPLRALLLRGFAGRMQAAFMQAQARQPGFGPTGFGDGQADPFGEAEPFGQGARTRPDRQTAASDEIIEGEAVEISPERGRIPPGSPWKDGR